MTDMASLMAELYGRLGEYLILLAVCSERMMIVFIMFPPTADGVLQGVVRNGIVLLFSSFIAFGQRASFMHALSGAVLFEVGLREALIGLVLGFAASTVFWVAESAGTYIDDLTGYNSIQITNPSRAEQNTPTGTLLAQIAGVAFWTLGGMTVLLGVLYDSYNWWPIASKTPIASNILESFAIRQTDTLMQMTAKLATPMMLILLLIDFAFGFAAKSAQKLDLVQLSQPVKGAMTVLMIALFAGIFIEQVHSQILLTGLTEQLRALSGAAR
jgi:type III secretion protein T